MGEDGGLVVLPTKREVKVLNPVGMRVFDLLDGTRSEEEIVETVAAEFEVSRDDATRDVRDFLEDLRREGMLIETAEQAAPDEVH
jgi:hypothetical protein